MEYKLEEKHMRSRVIRRSNYIKGVMKTLGNDSYDQDHFKLFKKLDDWGDKVIAKVAPKLAAKMEAKEQAGMADGKYTFGEKLATGFEGTKPLLATAAILTGLGFAANAINKSEDKRDLIADQNSSINAGNISNTNANPDAPLGKALGVAPAVSSSIAGGDPVKADIVTTAVKPVSDIVSTKTPKIDTVVTIGKKLLGTKSTGTNPVSPSNVALKRDEPVQTNVVQASTPVSMNNMTVIYIAIGAVVLVVLFSKFKS